MGYRDDFYAVANIIGYSGSLQSFPTVYFQTATEYGHITQKHDTSQNVGRMEVSKSKDYRIGNETIQGQLRLVERVGGRPIHVSRSTLTRVAAGDTATLAILAQAIWKYDGEKYITHYDEDTFDMMDAAANAKAAMHQELLAR